MAHLESKKVIFAAVAANLAIAAVKLVAATLTGSAAMLSESIHSLVDTADGVLLWYGTRRSLRGPDERHPFGHGQELYFWTVMVAVLIFGVGGVMSFYEGIHHWRHPRPLEHMAVNYVVLGVAALLEGMSWVVAARSFAAAKGARGVWQTIRGTKDPTVFAILLEDSAALAGLVLAFLGLWLGQLWHEPRLDAAASLAIGATLMIVSLILARESLGLLTGESASGRTVASIRALVAADPAVEHVGRILTAHFGPRRVLLNLEVQLRSDPTLSDVRAVLQRLQQMIRDKHPEVEWVFFGAEGLASRRAQPVAALSAM